MIVHCPACGDKHETTEVEFLDIQEDLFGRDLMTFTCPVKKTRAEGLVMRGGREEAEIGMRRAIDHANRVEPTWSDQAYSILREVVAIRDQFITEDVRRYADERGLARPPDSRAWGAVMIRASKAGLVKKIGWATATDPKVHANPTSLWKSLILGA